MTLLLAAFAGALLSVPLTYFAAHRSARQPVQFDLAAERRLLLHVEADPVQWAWVSTLTPDHFADPRHGERWHQLSSFLAGLPVPTTAVSEADGVRIVDELRNHPSLPTSAALADRLGSFPPLMTPTRAEVDGVTPISGFDDLRDTFETIEQAWHDRTQFNGVNPIETGADGEDVLVRRPTLVSPLRLVVVAVICSLAFSVSLAAADAFATSTAARLLAAAALVVLSLASVAWAVVDFDTMYLDTPMFWPTTAAAWLLAVLAGGLDQDWRRALAGVAVAVVGALVFEGSNLAYRLVRGRDGMGGGDTLILLATAGVPAAITGAWVLGYYVLIGSMVTAIVGWVVQRAVGRLDRHTPTAFGPYLALGWIIAVAVWLLQH